MWQRGVGPTALGSTATAYGPDELRLALGTTGSWTWSQQAFTYGDSTVPVALWNLPYYFRVAQTTAATSGTPRADFIIPDVRQFAGKTAYFSFYARCPTLGPLNFGITTFQSFGTGGSTSVTSGNLALLTIPTAWTQFTYALAVPGIAGGTTIGPGSCLAIQLATKDPSLNFEIDVAAIAVSQSNPAIADPARAFTDEALLYQTFERLASDVDGQPFGDGVIVSGTSALIDLFWQPKQAIPTVTRSSNSDFSIVQNGNTGSPIAVTGMTFANIGRRGCQVTVSFASGGTTGAPARLIAAASHGTSAHIDVSAEYI
jgi:hypothetical protein